MNGPIKYLLTVSKMSSCVLNPCLSLTAYSQHCVSEAEGQQQLLRRKGRSGQERTARGITHPQTARPPTGGARREERRSAGLHTVGSAVYGQVELEDNDWRKVWAEKPFS